MVTTTTRPTIDPMLLSPLDGIERQPTVPSTKLLLLLIPRSTTVLLAGQHIVDLPLRHLLGIIGKQLCHQFIELLVRVLLILEDTSHTHQSLSPSD